MGAMRHMFTVRPALTVGTPERPSPVRLRRAAGQWLEVIDATVGHELPGSRGSWAAV